MYRAVRIAHDARMTVTARYMDSDDVIFGAMVTGRQAPLQGLDRMVAPLINDHGTKNHIIRVHVPRGKDCP
jgi:hypothetical protein